MAVHTKLDLFQMQSLPLDAKIRMTVRRITDFIEYHDAYISISGGKDSRVLDDIESRFIGAGLPRVFVDTGLEHRSVRACGKRHADVTVRPEKNFKQIITEYGYPVISKEVAQTIAEARVGLKSGKGYTYRMEKLDGVAVDKNGEKSKYNIPQYKFLLDIRVSGQTFKAVCAGLLPYLLLKYEKYSIGEIAVIQEFEEGRATGNTKEVYISCMDTEETHTAIAGGYCVLGICEKEIAVEKGWFKEVSETDTEGGNFRDK